LMYAAVGFGVLTKGPVAAALPAIVFALYFVVHGEIGRLRQLMLPAGILIVAAIVLPWYAVLYQRYGWTYISPFFFVDNIARYTEGVGVQTSRGFWYYLPVVFTDSAPVSLLLVISAGMWIADRRRSAGPAPAPLRVRTLLWLWIVTIVGFFSFSAAKQDLYIFPIVPAVAALAGAAIARALRGDWLRGVRASILVIGLLLAVLGV